MPAQPTTLIIGGGIAGLAAAALPELDGAVTLLETEPRTFAHSSGRNAAIFRPLEESECLSELAVRSEHLLRELDAPAGVLQRQGLLLAATTSVALNPLLATAVAMGLPHHLLARRELEHCCPLLEGGECDVAIHLPDAGVLELELLETWLRRRLNARGITLRTGAKVTAIRRQATRVEGVVLSSGEQLNADRVVIAAGAWSAGLGDGCGCPLPIAPHRRHLVQFTARQAVSSLPVAWNVERNVYVKAHGPMLVASPGDHTPHAPGLPAVDEALLGAFQGTLAKLGPGLADLPRERAWACLRTVTPDGHPVVGADPRLQGLYWFAGLGGVGMTTGLACAQRLGLAFAGGPPNPKLDPARWLD